MMEVYGRSDEGNMVSVKLMLRRGKFKILHMENT
jgi:hypothetical protein